MSRESAHFPSPPSPLLRPKAGEAKAGEVFSKPNVAQEDPIWR